MAVVSRSELARKQSVVPRGCKPEDAQGRTVGLSVQITGTQPCVRDLEAGLLTVSPGYRQLKTLRPD